MIIEEFDALAERLRWHDKALCSQVDPELWYPEDPGPSEAAKICKKCDVRAECLFDAVDRYEFWGVWGGLPFDKRKALRKELTEKNNGRKITLEDIREYLESERRRDELRIQKTDASSVWDFAVGDSGSSDSAA